MRISDEDRLLAAELVDALGIDQMHEGTLRVILSAHRQLPANEKPVVAEFQACGSVHPNSTGPVTCGLRLGHSGRHQTARNPVTGHRIGWSS